MTNDEIRGFIENAIKENQRDALHEGHARSSPRAASPRARPGALNALGVKYAALDILPDPRIREELSGCRAGRRSRSCSWTASWSGGSDIVHGDVRVRRAGRAAGRGAARPGRSRRRSRSSRSSSAPIGLENRLN